VGSQGRYNQNVFRRGGSEDHKPNYSRIIEKSKYIIKYERGPETPAQNKPSKCNQSYGGLTKTKTFVFSSEKCSFTAPP
jgi:hypothetical protein